MPKRPYFQVKLPPLSRAAVPFVRALNEMLVAAAAEFADDGLERIEEEIHRPAAERMNKARGVAQKHKRRKRS